MYTNIFTIKIYLITNRESYFLFRMDGLVFIVFHPFQNNYNFGFQHHKFD